MSKWLRVSMENIEVLTKAHNEIQRCVTRTKTENENELNAAYKSLENAFASVIRLESDNLIDCDTSGAKGGTNQTCSDSLHKIKPG